MDSELELGMIELDKQLADINDALYVELTNANAERHATLLKKAEVKQQKVRTAKQALRAKREKAVKQIELEREAKVQGERDEYEKQQAVLIQKIETEGRDTIPTEEVGIKPIRKNGQGD